jgi:hypothetical protein
MAKTTTSKPARPVAPVAAPAKPAKPGKPVPPAAVAAPTPPAAPAKPGKPGKPVVTPPAAAPAAAAPAPVPGVGSAILAKLEAMDKEIRDLQKQVAKDKATPVNTARTKEQILEGAKVPEGDWREQYIGYEMNAKAFETKGDALIVHEESGVFPVLLALPRDADPGKQGAQARAAGRLALHWQTDEQGNYPAQPVYITQDELGSIWAD